MKKILKVFIALFLLLIVGLVITAFVLHQKLPIGEGEPKADVMARRMLKAMNQDAYRNTRFLEWSYQGGKNNYKWDKAKGICTVTWENYQVELRLSAPSKSTCSVDGVKAPKEKCHELVEYALKNFNNDSFWLVAPYKVFDKGTKRSIVPLEDGSEGLLVTYASGGTTPGDSYLWKLNNDGFPKSYHMWVDIIPVGGLEASWDDWLVTESGALLPKSHKLGPITLSMGDVKGYNE